MGQAPLIFLMGPSAAGKTAAAVELVRRFPLDIVSVDSAMVYRGMDIGTAKPGPDILAEAPHRLIDIRDPAEGYSAGEFRTDALAHIEEIRAAGRVPLLVGGTMLYFRALAGGLDELPRADPATRAALDAEARERGWPALHEELAQHDPPAAARIHPNDAQRIQRALEVLRLTGQPLSSQQTGARPGPPALRLVWTRSNRETLYRACRLRMHAMLEAGFVNEVEALYRRGDLTADMPSVRAVGYRQLWEHVAGRCTREVAVERAIVATRRLIKRQLTWLRGEQDLVWLDADTDGTRRLQDIVNEAVSHALC